MAESLDANDLFSFDVILFFIIQKAQYLKTVLFVSRWETWVCDYCVLSADGIPGFPRKICT